MNIVWAQIRRDSELSWHAVRTGTRAMCGRQLDAATAREQLPAEKSCEVCLRSVAAAVDGA